jgi:hypothetical protein
LAALIPLPELDRNGRMEIQVLKLLVTEQEVNALVAREAAGGGTVRDLSVRFGAEGISIKGKYQMVMPMRFETLWKVGVEDGRIVAQLVDMRVVGFPAAMLKGSLMSLIVESIQADGALEAHGDALRIDVDRLLAQRGFPARTNLTGVRCAAGKLIIESALAPGERGT